MRINSSNIEKIRADFPILELQVSGKPLVYLDNAASSQMPQAVIDRIVRYQTEEHANIHRAVHYLSELATKEFEAARVKVQHFLNAMESREIIFTRGTTEAINLVMHGYGRAFIGKGDEIILSAMEHHANIVPWQMLVQEKGAVLRVIPMNDAGELLIDEFEALFNSRTKFLALSHVSNALGTINPVKQMVAFAHQHGVPVLLDGAQAAPHQPIDVQDLDCDFYAFSGHKLCGPTGIGALYGKAHLLEKMQPYQGGGDMILSVTFEKTTYNVIPAKFEAGTPPIMAAIGLGAAIDYLNGIGIANIDAYVKELLDYATAQVSAMPGVRIIGTASKKAAVLSFEIDGVHPHDVGTILNDYGIAIRTGHHCAQPVMQRFHVPATARASFAFYNTREEIDKLVNGIRKVQEMFA
ncbi:MAG: cysteine sulfinate desulfinase [Gallionellales bacterium RIFCSPLOWO2_12_FULL_57_18]|nr:MAG: cysteine sulfinate desulfinase [Gallionellales bacterium RIFCSPLOWO2_12_FULL_57_18]OGS96508.1 MAG: cysteine sulfinate desulfinase [Gallionellales bacterium RIFCSPLOWO2_02_FULL_57_47]OGT10314.1 MAG: cysteine sulfinate desulfinase [Gallionellales bacterium RIFCSPHIGHO2_02_FULL_57_16]